MNGLPHMVDADGCEVTVGMTTWVPWRWAHTWLSCGRGRSEARERCRLNGQKSLLRDPEDGSRLMSTAEIPWVDSEPFGHLTDPPVRPGRPL